jgi:transposase
MNNSNFSYCAIDVSKDHLDTKCRNNVNRYDNTIKGIKKLAKENPNAHYVFESTGGYERLAAWTLLAGGYKVSIVNPRPIRDFAKAMSILAKTDKLDADVILKYAKTVHPRETQLPSEEYRHFVAVMDRRYQLKKMKVAEGNRLCTCYDQKMRKSIEISVMRLKREIKDLEKELISLIKNDEELNQKSMIMKKVDGIGDISAANILAYMPEIGTLNRREVAGRGRRALALGALRRLAGDTAGRPQQIA